jgi:Uma2 family endonuclease
MGGAIETEDLRRFTRREYDALVEQGFFGDENVELLRGVVVTMSPQGPGHWHVSSLLMHVLARALPVDTYVVAAHSGFAAADDSEPEPDLGVYERVRARGQIPSEALLIVEVANTSLRRDRSVKLPIYAEAGVPEYWIVVLPERQVEVYTQPRSGAYMHMERVLLDGVLRPQFEPTIEIATNTLPWN